MLSSPPITPLAAIALRVLSETARLNEAQQIAALHSRLGVSHITLSFKLQRLAEAGLITFKSTAYKVTAAGLAWLAAHPETHSRTPWTGITNMATNRPPQLTITDSDRQLIDRLHRAPQGKRGRIEMRMNRQAEPGTAEVLIYGAIGDYGFPDDITAKQFRKQLSDLGNVQRISLRINSPGGDVFDAMAIYNSLREHGAKITATVDGLAASAASWILQAADERVAFEASELMIHNANWLVIGTKEDMRSAAVILEKMDNQIIDLYRSRSRKSRSYFGEAMNAETWYTPAEALDAGLIDRVIPLKGANNWQRDHDLSNFRNAPRRHQVVTDAEIDERLRQIEIDTRLAELEGHDGQYDRIAACATPPRRRAPSLADMDRWMNR
jgi:ATP-dependent protease ClpP protease subunit